MATKLAYSDTHICNMALARLGALRITNFDDNSEETTQAIQCRLHYAQTRDALLRSHWWRFARARKVLSANATDEPLGEWDNAYDLPADFLSMKNVYEEVASGEVELQYSYSLEGKQLLSNQDSMEIRYIKRVTDPTQFDPLFVEVLILSLALKLVMPLTQDMVLRKDLRDELWGTPRQPGLMKRVRAMDKRETDTTGRSDRDSWNDARTAGVGI